MAATKVWGVSDPHIFHKFVSNLRGYTVQDFNDMFVSDWINKVATKDQVWLLGDLTGGGYINEAIELIGELPGEKHLMIGNHDDPFPGHRDAHRKLKKYYEVFTSVQLHTMRSINGVRCLVSHFPYSGDHSSESRYDQWRLPDLGLPIIHGHTHSKNIVSYSSKGTLQINIAWEAVGGLITFDSLQKYIGSVINV